MGVTVTRAGVGDVTELAPLFDAYRQFYGRPPDAAAGAAFLAARLAAGESVVLSAAGGDGPSAVGFVQLYPSFTSVGLAAVWLLNDLYVAPDARRRGAARALLAGAAEFARSTGAARVRLSTAATNNEAKALYLACGYRLTGFEQFELTV